MSNTGFEMGNTDFEWKLGYREGYDSLLAGEGYLAKRRSHEFHSSELYAAYLDGWGAGVWDAAGVLVAKDEQDGKVL
jgi:hypothetical protein